MIITLEPGVDASNIMERVKQLVSSHPKLQVRLHEFQGENVQYVAEIHLIGDTKHIPKSLFTSIPKVSNVTRVSKKYHLIGRPEKQTSVGFDYNGVSFRERDVVICAGQCAADTKEHADAMFKALARNGITTARMGVYKPRTSPYDFQGLGDVSLPWLFELAGKHGIKIIALEVCNERQLESVLKALESSGNATGVMLQVGTRNAQNYELLKCLGQQKKLPVLFKRGMGLTLEESLNACEYIASEGTQNIVFCLRGVKTHLSDPHRNMPDFGQVPVVRRLTRLPVCIDPSHSIGSLQCGPDGILDIYHATGQGIIAGASMVLIEFHPDPQAAQCDRQQALHPDDLPKLQQYVLAVRAAYNSARAIW